MVVFFRGFSTPEGGVFLLQSGNCATLYVWGLYPPQRDPGFSSPPPLGPSIPPPTWAPFRVWDRSPLNPKIARYISQSLPSYPLGSVPFGLSRGSPFILESFGLLRGSLPVQDRFWNPFLEGAPFQIPM